MHCVFRFGIAAVLSGTAVTAATVASHAQQPIELPGIYVQGATLEAPQQPTSGAVGDGRAEDLIAGVPAYTIGNAVTVVTGEQLRREQVRHAGEALRSMPGVSVGRSGGFGNITQVRIRGAEGNHTLVLIDGIEANNTADGEFDFSNLSAEEIDRIEIIRGPMSGLYGSNAVGGVINIVTRRGRGPLALTLRTEAGSLATRDAAARLSGGSENGHLAISYHWRDTGGYNIAPTGDERDGSRLGSFAMKGGARLLEGVTLDFTVRHVNKNADRDGFGPFGGTPGALATAFDERSTLEHSVLLAGANLRWETMGGRLTHEVFANRNHTITADTDRGQFPAFTKNDSETDRFGYLATLRFGSPRDWLNQTLSARVEHEAERFVPSGDFADGIERERARASYTAEWRGAFVDKLFLTAGIRHDDNNNFQDFTTWRMAASLVLRELNMRPHASVGTAVKLPTMFEQFGTSTFFVPNPNLTPEESFGWDAGIEFTLLRGRAILDVTYFDADLTDKINGSAPGPLPGTFTAVNLPGESTRRGVEVSGRLRVTESLTLGAAYTYTDARAPSGQREIRRPPHSARADLGYTFAGGRGTASFAAIYNGRTADTAFELPFFTPTHRVVLDEYWLLSVAASYKVQPGVEIFGRVENLLDQSYQEVFGFEAAPITAFAGVKLTFGGPEGLGGSWGK